MACYSLGYVNCTTELGVICMFAEGTLDPTADANEDIKEYGKCVKNKCFLEIHFS